MWKWTSNVFRATDNLENRTVSIHAYLGGVDLQTAGRDEESMEKFPLIA